MDLAGFPGEPVLAAGAGDVSYAGLLAGRGVVVVIHGRLRTTYEPVTATVRRGAHVAAGEQIAFLSPGHPGCPSAACLHWGLLRGETYLDPLALLHRAVIRLLPLDGAPGHTSPALDANLRGAETTALLSPATHPLGSDARPSPVAWSLAALAGGGVVLAFRRR